MTKKTRYLLILIGFIFFLFSAPLIVIYVRGLRFDFAARKFVHTGVLAVNTEPDSTQIFLDGKLIKTSSKNIRFLLPKEYQINISKDGFFTWQKQLSILPDQVTWTNSGVEKIFLLKDHSEIKTLAENVTDYVSDGNKIIYYDQANLYFSSALALKNIKKIQLPETIAGQKIKLIPNTDYSFALLFSENTLKTSGNKILFVDFSEGTVSDISSMLSNNSQIILLNNGKILSLENGILFLVDTATKTKAVIQNNVMAFNFSVGVYSITKDTDKLNLNYQELNNTQNQVLLKNLPELSLPQILISDNKQIFLLAQEGLFKINSGLDKISDMITDWNFSRNIPEIIYSSYGEINYYDFLKQQPQTITRSSATVKNLRISQKIGYAFFLKNNQLNALELDERGNQNEYNLYSSPNLKKFELDSNFKNLLILDGNTLKYFSLR